MRTTLLLLLGGFATSKEFWDYTYGATMNCTKISQPTPQEYWAAFTLHDLDRYTFLVASPLVLLLMALTLLTYLIKDSRARPSDIILALCLCEIMVISSSFAEAIFETQYDAPLPPPSFLGFCTTSAVFALSGWVGINYYNMLFCIVLAYSVRNTLKGTFMSNIVYHSVGFTCMCLVTIVIFFTSGLGKSVNGLCAVRFSNVAPFVILTVPIALIVLASVSIYRFRTGIPKNSFFRHQSVYNYYYIYIFSVIALQVIISTLGLIGDLNCKSDQPDPSLAVSFSLGNISTLLRPVMIAFIRYHHPAVKGTIKKKLRLIFSPKKISDDIFEDVLSGEEEVEVEDYNWLGSLLESIRGSQVFSFLTGMLVSHIEFQMEVVRNIKQIDYCSHYVFNINENSADNYLEKRVNPRESRRVKHELGGLKPLDYEVTSFCPRMFKYICASTGLNLENSLSILLNSEMIKKVAHVDGGKSGEFFFCSHDFNILFKTVSEQQAALYIEGAKKFFCHFQSEEHSLISKIIGLYRFRRTDIIDSSVYIILQKNLSMCDRVHILRTFDLKGSKYNRETLAEKSVDDLSTVTLKDIDFLKTEDRIFVSPITAKNIKRILCSDIQMLKSLGVMDYSLLIMKINWDQAAFFNKSSIREVIPRGSNPFEVVPSEVEEGVYYHFTIIDYLQTWNVFRQTQNFLKKMIVREFTESVITAEEPLTYAYRLNKFLDVIF